MSYDCYAMFLQGFEVDIKPKYKKIKKFNEDTGEPYEADAFEYDEMYLNGLLIATNQFNDDAFYDSEKIEGLEVAFVGYDGERQYFLGARTGAQDQKYKETPAPSKELIDFCIRYNVEFKNYLICRGS